MNDLICHVAPLGMNPDWIKEGLLYYNWNYLIILTTDNKEYIELANKLRDDLILSYKLTEERKLDSKIIKDIEIIEFKTRLTLDFIEVIKNKLKEIRKVGYNIYFNATSGLQIWKFAAYFIGTIESLIDKFYYIPTDTDLEGLVKPLEIYLPIPISESLKNLLLILKKEHITQKQIVEQTKFSKGLISRYLKNLRELGLIEISTNVEGKEKFFNVTEKGEWYL